MLTSGFNPVIYRYTNASPYTCADKVITSSTLSNFGDIYEDDEAVHSTEESEELGYTTVVEEQSYDQGQSALVVGSNVVDSSLLLRNSKPQTNIWLRDGDGRILNIDLTPRVDYGAERIAGGLDVLSYRKFLVDVYGARPEVPRDSWPPNSSTYIKLSLVNIDSSGKRCTGIDSVIKGKDIVDQEELFAGLQSGTRLFVEGRPGSGKTTLVHKISQDWAKGDRSYGNIKLLFLCHLGRFFNDPHIQLCDIIQYHILESKYVNQIMQLAEDGNGEGLCFILDGLDEYNPRSKSGTFVFQLIRKKVLPRSVVIVASRPAAIAKLRKTATKQVEVLGFVKDQISQYISSYAFTEHRKRDNLQHYLVQHPSVFHMCYLPIHTAMVCFLFDATGSIPQTFTEMYTEITRIVLLRYLRRSRYGENCHLKSAADLPSKEKEIFLRICELGFDKTVSSEQVSRSKVGKLFASKNETLGLVCVDSLGSRYGLYTFLHLTLQEFLAAYHISQLEEEEQQRIIYNCGKRKQMLLVWKFYCGLVDVNAHKFNSILLLGDSLFSVQCSFESQQPITCDSIIRSGESGTLALQHNFLTPTDFTAMSYVIKNTTFAVKTIEFDSCRLDGVTVEPVSVLLSICTDLQALSLTRCDDFFSDGGAIALASGLQSCVNLQEIALYDNNIGVQGMKVLARGLAYSTNLQTLNLQRNDIGMDGIIALSETLKNCRSLQILDLQENDIDAEGVAALTMGLKYCTNLRRLMLGLNSFGLSGTRILALNLKSCPNLRTLDLHSVNMGADGVKALTEGLKHCTNLEVLELSYNELCADGVKELATSLQLCYRLQTLGLQNNVIGDCGAMALADTGPTCKH